MPSERPVRRIAAIVVNWSRPAYTVQALAAVHALRYPCHRLVVVDNGSDQIAKDWLRSKLPASAQLVELASNAGFTGGYNAGLRAAFAPGLAQADYALLLNDDTLVAPSTVGALVEAAEANTDAAFLGPLLLTTEDRSIILSAGGILGSDGMASMRGLGEINNGQYARVERVDFLSGAALLVRRTAAEAVGLLDEDFFAYWEDVEWATRAARQGYVSLLVPSAIAFHPDTRQRDETAPGAVYYMARNQLVLTQKMGTGGALAFRFAGHLRTLASWSLRPRWRHKRAQRDALARALWDFVRGYRGAWTAALATPPTRQAGRS